VESLHWDVLRLWSEIQHGLGLAWQRARGRLVSLGIDTWGVDFALLANDDSLLGNPYHYRDRRTNGMVEAVFERLPKEEIYRQTGIQFLELNSLYQLYAMVHGASPILAAAHSFLMIPDLFNFWLCGRKGNEYTNTTTTQCYNPRTGAWADSILSALDIPEDIFGEIIQPGTHLELLRSSVAEAAACPRLPVIAVGSHDTASAVAAVPAESRDIIFISSGTWSLMGVELEHPVISEQSLAFNFTNEGGVGGTIRLLKNIMGLWLVQECRREWEKQGHAYTYADLTQMAESAPAFGSLVSVGSPFFLSPGEMPFRIQQFCRKTEQPIPVTHGAILRCALESLALEYRKVAEQLDFLVGHRMPTIHVIGGGSRNRLLNQMTANATRRVVIAGPVEATSIGNLLVQLQAAGYIDSLSEGRCLVRHSFELEYYHPTTEAQDADAWDAAYLRYRTLVEV
jgi:rhamnulokinase